MDVPVSSSINFILVVGGYAFSIVLGLVIYLLKRRNEEIDRQREVDKRELEEAIERVSNREETRWVTYTDRHAVVVGKVDILQDNYKSTVEYIREDMREIKSQAQFIPVMKNEIDNLKHLIEDRLEERQKSRT